VRTNVFVPVRPISQNSKGYENYLNYLTQANAFSSLSGSGIYRWLDNPALKISPLSFGKGKSGNVGLLPMRRVPMPTAMEPGPVADLPQIKKSLYEVPERFPYKGAAGAAQTGRREAKALVQLKEGLSPGKANSVFAHEVDHAVNAKKNLTAHKQAAKKGWGSRFLYDRANDEVMPHDKYSNKAAEELGSDVYKRAHHEIRANSAQANDITMSRAPYNETAAAPNKQVIELSRDWMQDPKLVKKASDAFMRYLAKGKAAAKAATPALGIAGGLVDALATGNLLKNVKKYGGSLAPYKKYLGENVQEDWL